MRVDEGRQRGRTWHANSSTSKVSDRSFGPVDVLLDINLLVQDGDRIGIVGHNGAGKTTLLNTISERKDVGEINLHRIR